VNNLNFTVMKKIEAVIRKSKFEEVKDALSEAGIDFFSFWDVRGIGKARQGRIYRGIKYDTSTIERTKISIIVRDKNVEKTVLAIMKSGRTGEIGDGKIFIVNIEESYRIRTGEFGDESLYIKDEEA
jgi:nitrogen regulatory protein P-II 1